MPEHKEATLGQRYEIADAAYSLVVQQVRFKDQGRSVEGGVDCSGVLIVSARKVGAPYIDNARHSKRPNTEEMLTALRDQMIVQGAADADVGDVVIVREPSWPCHYAIVDRYRPGDAPGSKYMIHASARHKKMVREKFAPGNELRRTRRTVVMSFRAKEW